MRTHCRCCKMLLSVAATRPSDSLCVRCAAGRCPRGRTHRVAVVDGVEDGHVTMSDFLETVHYVGNIRPWRDVPETEESDDEPEDEEET